MAIVLKKNKISIRWQLFGYLAVLIGGLLIVLWLFQVVFMDSFYRNIKKNEVIKVGEVIEKNFDNPNLLTMMNNLAERRDVCIVITNAVGEISYSSRNNIGNHILLRLTPIEYCYLGVVAKQAGGEILYWDNENRWQNPLDKQASFAQKNNIGIRNNKDDAVILTKVISTDNGDYIVMINTFVSPVTATVSTIRKQLVYVTVIMLLLAFLLALLIAKKIANPIIEMNDSAKALAASNNEAVVFTGKGYKEISELSSTLTYVSSELAKTEGLRRELIANVSHDLRTPLTLICGYAEMMRDLPGENTPENTQVIIDEATRLTKLVNDMLDLSKLQAGTQALDIKRYNLTQNIEEIMKRYAALTEQEGYHISFEYDDEVEIEGDELKISQVIYNLINNAINYTGNDKKVAVKQKIVDNKVRIEVSDTGEGISKENLPYIWDRYYKVDKTHKRAAIGTGLGLSIVQNILKAHRAEYGVESEVHKGSTFWFELEQKKKV